MKVLVTGAGGFLGRRVAAALAGAGHDVRALVRPGRDARALGLAPPIEPFVADLRHAADLDRALEGVDAVVHLAAAMSGSDAIRFADTVIATERLFDAMARSSVRRLVLCSSFSVYDWTRARGVVDESLPLRERPYDCGGYASAKVWQERLAERRAAELGWELTILRPGFIWGDANPCPDDTYGRTVGGLHLVFGPLRRPALTHVDNCADAFRAALESPASVGRAINVTDADDVTAWRFLGDHVARSGRGGRRVPIPYAFVALLAFAVQRVAALVWGARAKLPSLFARGSFAEGYRPRRHARARLEALLPAHRPGDYATCLDRTYPPRARSSAARAPEEPHRP
ncbi:MAG: NAD(P)-dependent oxidoreductase [Myxococcota bacterium]